MSTSIPVFSDASHFVRMATDHEARAMLLAGTHDLIRDRSGKSRRLYERFSPEPITREKQEHFRWRGKMSGGAIVMQAQRLGFS